MKQVTKGSAGYINYKKKINLIIVIAGLIIIAADFFTGLIITGTRNNLFTVTAIVLVLPVGKFFATYLSIARFKSIPEQLYNKIEKLNLKYPVAYDCAMSTPKAMVFVEAMLIGPDYICCYTSDQKADRKYFEEFLEGFVKDGKVKVKVTLLKDEKAFINRLRQLADTITEPDDYTSKTIDMVRTSALSMCV